jgi:hypothetical protein
MLMSLSTNVPSCTRLCLCCPLAGRPAAVAGADAGVTQPWLQSCVTGSSSSRSDTSLPCRSSPDSSVVQLPTCNSKTVFAQHPLSTVQKVSKAVSLTWKSGAQQLITLWVFRTQVCKHRHHVIPCHEQP